ncbi:MAG: DUF1565 domain-containing protein [Elainellaceae cyanobacterium]
MVLQYSYDLLRRRNECSDVGRGGRRVTVSPQILLAAGLGLAVVVSLTSQTGAIAQTTLPISSSQARRSYTPPATSTTLFFVNPIVGHDTQGDGSQRSPFRTITQALERSQPGTVIMLAPGTYSAESGEQFPLRMKPGVIIQGNPSTHGDGILIRGGGRFLSPTVAGQNIAILGADDATLTGVTVRNPNARGYGLWIESSSPTVARNTFSNNIHDGVSVNGDSSPIVQDNLFRQNGANGITVFGSGQAVVRENVFEQTGFGINVSQNAAPHLIENRLLNNRDGIVIQGHARPVLRHNVIDGSHRDGIVAIAQAVPNLGTPDHPGNNQFQNNTRYDLNVEAAEHPVPAFGNDLTDARMTGAVDVTGNVPIPIAAPRRVAADLRPDSSSSENSLSSSLPVLPTSSEAPARSSSGEESSSASSMHPHQGEPSSQAIAAHPTSRQSLSSASLSSASSSSASSSSASSSSASSSSASLSTVPSPTASSRPASSRTAASFPRPTDTGAAATPSPQRIPSIDMFVPPPSVPTSTPPAPPPPAPAVISAVTESSPSPQRAIADRSTTPRLNSDAQSAPSRSARPVANFTAPIEIPVPPPMRGTVADLSDENDGQASPVNQLASALASAQSSPSAQQPSSPPRNLLRTLLQPRSSPPRHSNALPVPGGEIPRGYTGSLPTVTIYSDPVRQRTSAGSSPNRSTRLRSRYRVVVDARNERIQRLVQSLVPGAFYTYVNGQAVMQAGAFNDLNNANETARMLINNGLRVAVQRIE